MYIPFKITTDNSLLKSLIKVKDLINFCIEKNIKVCGICDVNLFGAIEFYNLCQKNNIKPIIGLEININNLKVYLYAMNYSGYKNLLKIHTIITDRLINIDELKEYSNDILVILPYESISLYNELYFISNLYIGYQNEKERNNSLIKTQNIVYVNDIKAFYKEDLKYLKYLDILSGNNLVEYTNNYFNFNLDDFDLEKMDEVNKLIDLKIENNKRYIPVYCEDSYSFLVSLCIKGLKKRLNNNVKKEYVDRLKHELNIIKKMGFVDYFLIVYDYVLFAKKNNILVGPGRGSAAGSLVSYVIGITDIDPIKYNLLFERFLNYERVTMPDIDIDFENTKRDLVIAYVKEKYGENNVSGGITFSTFKTRLVLRDVSKILKIDERLINQFIKTLDKNKDLKSNLNNDIVKKYLSNYDNLNNLYNICLKLEGLKKNISTHAAGIVISNIPLDEIIPMYKNKDVYLTGVTMEHLEDLGLLKMDFLALKNLNTISSIIKNIPNFKLSAINLNDKLVYDLFCKGDTDGIFQFETPTFKSMLVKYEPKNFLELVASIALVRPGPSRELETYIKRKKGLEKVIYYDESLKDILEETYGVIVYQEQVINILVRMAKFTYAEADNIRWAMSKKKEEMILTKKDEFIKRCIQNGYNKELATKVYDAILEFASYGFNKSHSVAYALVSYQMAYLKVHYNALFNFVMLDENIGSIDITKKYLNDLKLNNYKINKVDINISTNNFIIKDKVIYLPFKVIKNLNREIVNKLLEERNRNGIFESIFDVFRRTCNFINRNEYIKLINAGVFDTFNYNTSTLVNNLDLFIDYGSLYNDLGELALKPNITSYEDDINILKLNELDSYGFYISNHPSSVYTDNNVLKVHNIKNYAFKNVLCYVLVENIKKIKTKKDEDMAFINGSDETGNADFTVFPNAYGYLQNCHKNDMIKVWGSVTKRYDKYSIIVKGLEVI